MTKAELHNIFLERLDSLAITRDFSYKEENYSLGCLFSSLTYTAQKKYIHKNCDISENNYDSWKKKQSTTVPDAETLYRIATEFGSSIDFLLGLTDAKGTQTEEDIKEYTGLEIDAIRQLHAWKTENKKRLFLHAQLEQSINALNTILCHKYRQEKRGLNGFGTDVLHFIGAYLTSDKIVRETGYARFQSGSRFTKLEKGDIVIKADTKEEMPVDVPLVTHEITGNIGKLGLYEEGNPDNRYVAKISDLYKAASLSNIGKVLDKIMEKQNE